MKKNRGTRGHGEKYSQKKEDALASLLRGGTMKEMAKRARIGERTLRRWREKPDLQRDYEEAKRDRFNASLSALTDAAPLAVERLVEMIDYGEDQFEACKFLVETVLKAKKMEDEHDARQPEQETLETQGIRPVKAAKRRNVKDETSQSANVEDQAPSSSGGKGTSQTNGNGARPRRRSG